LTIFNQWLGEFAKLIEFDGEPESVGEKDFDPQGQYHNVVTAVKKAGDGKVEVLQVPHGGTRSEFYVVSLDKEHGRIVGLKALAIQS
jgi:hypothetical protein